MIRMVLRPRHGAAIALLVVVGAWIVDRALILLHRILVSHDTLSNYAHVWYVNDRLRHGHGVPFRMPVIGHGDAYAFPYGFVPWLSAALLWGLLGPRVVTLLIVLGFIWLVASLSSPLPTLL